MTWIWAIILPLFADDLTAPWEKLTLVGAMAAGIFAFLRGWVVPGWIYRDALASNERLREQNLQLRRLANAATTTTERVVEQKSPPVAPHIDSGD